MQTSATLYQNQQLVFNHVISLGCACNTSLYLKELGLKTYSLPYDWIFSNLDMIEHTIEDDFQSFLDRQLMFARNPKQAGHQQYHDMLFNHRNPKDNQEDYDYYQRCINRFKQILKTNDTKLFIHTMYQEPKTYHGHFVKFKPTFKNVYYDLEKIKNFHTFLGRITSKYFLLVIIQNPKQEQSQINKIFEQENLLVYSLDCLGLSAGEFLSHPQDHQNYQTIIKQFNYELKNLQEERLNYTAKINI